MTPRTKEEAMPENKLKRRRDAPILSFEDPERHRQAVALLQWLEGWCVDNETCPYCQHYPHTNECALRRWYEE